MKIKVVLIFIFAILLGCKNDSKKEEETIVDDFESLEKVKVVSGTFMYYEDTAVFHSKSELFGVVENELLLDLILMSEPLKGEASEKVDVTLKVKTSKKPENEEGWDNRIEILEIVKISKVNPDNSSIIKIGKEQ